MDKEYNLQKSLVLPEMGSACVNCHSPKHLPGTVWELAWGMGHSQQAL